MASHAWQEEDVAGLLNVQAEHVQETDSLTDPLGAADPHAGLGVGSSSGSTGLSASQFRQFAKMAGLALEQPAHVQLEMSTTAATGSTRCLLLPPLEPSARRLVAGRLAACSL